MKLKVLLEDKVPHHRDTLYKAVRWSLSFFDLETKPATVVVVFKKGSYGVNSDHIELLGNCSWAGNSIEVEVYAGRPLYQVLRTLFHEIVHVKQLTCGYLDSDSGVVHWKGRPVMCEYAKMPHEIEARELAMRMLIAYTIHSTKEKVWKIMSGLGPVFKRLSKQLVP